MYIWKNKRKWGIVINIFEECSWNSPKGAYNRLNFFVKWKKKNKDGFYPIRGLQTKQKKSISMFGSLSGSLFRFFALWEIRASSLWGYSSTQIRKYINVLLCHDQNYLVDLVRRTLILLIHTTMLSSFLRISAAGNIYHKDLKKLYALQW